ncbi:MAG: riboflavin synthase [Candidatus Xenobia bacterium]
MFTGIVEATGDVVQAARHGELLRITVRSPLEGLAHGDSVAVSGVCLTVVDTSGADAVYEISPETLARTNLGGLRPGAMVNLERAITLATRLSGHLVQGHVDGTASLVGVIDHGDCHEVKFELPEALGRYCVEKGSIAINGVSLTLNAAGDGLTGTRVSIMLIPYTWSHTNLSHLAEGDTVNVEVDVLAKYVERLCRTYLQSSSN